MRLLVSVVDEEEVPEAISGGADIVDIKNPAEGSLGAPTPQKASRIIDAVNGTSETSCAIGDLPNLPGTVSLAASGAAYLSPDYIKLGLLGTRTQSEAKALLTPSVDIVKSIDPSIRIIACGYADWELVGSVSPLVLPQAASQSGADGVLIDTINKDGRCLFDFMAYEELCSFISHLQEMDMISALAGSLKPNHSKQLKTLSPDVIGIRGAACKSNDRRNGKITAHRVDRFKENLI